MCIKYLRKLNSEAKVVKSINKMNRKLKTTFSFIYCIEEIDLLSMIPETDTQEKLRLEHLSCVLDLWYKGIKDEYAYRNSVRRDEDYVLSFFKVFRKKLFDLLIKYELFKPAVLPESIVDSSYLVPIQKYEYQNSKDRLDNIDKAYEFVNTLNKKLELGSIKNGKEEKVQYFIKTQYFGSMQLYIGYPKMIRRDERNIFKGKILPFEFKRRTSLLKSLRVLKKKEIRIEEDILSYYSKEIKIMRKRLEFEENRIQEKHDNYDFYFDQFLWRLLNDLEYLYSKRLGGIRKIIDLVKINAKDKHVKIGAKEREAIVVDVDNMEATFEPLDNKGKKSSGGKSVGKQIDVNELDAKKKRENVRRDEIIREVSALARRR